MMEPSEERSEGFGKLGAAAREAMKEGRTPAATLHCFRRARLATGSRQPPRSLIEAARGQSRESLSLARGWAGPFAIRGIQPVVGREIYSPEKRRRLAEFDTDGGPPLLPFSQRHNCPRQFFGGSWINQPDFLAHGDRGLQPHQTSIGIYSHSWAALSKICATHNQRQRNVDALRSSPVLRGLATYSRSFLTEV